MTVTVPAGYTLTWIIRNAELIRSITVGGVEYTDVVCNLTYRLRAMNQYGRGVAIDNQVEIPIDSVDPETFVEFTAMTQEQAATWLKAQLGETIVAQLETRALAQLQNPDYAYLPEKGMPWYHQDPYDSMPRQYP